MMNKAPHPNMFSQKVQLQWENYKSCVQRKGDLESNARANKQL